MINPSEDLSLDAALELLVELHEEEQAEIERNGRTCPECGGDDVDDVHAPMGKVFECCDCGHDFDETGETVEPVNHF